MYLGQDFVKLLFVLTRNKVPYNLKTLLEYQTVCKAPLERDYVTRCFRYSFKEFRIEGDIDTTMNMLF